MMYQLTDEQAQELYIAICSGRSDEYGRIASEWLSANLPAPVPVLRPIHEMPPEVPEGYARAYWDPVNGFCCSYTEGVDTHAIDALIPDAPDPEAELRREFEKAIKEAEPLSALTLNLVNGVYALREHELAWKLFNAGKEAQRG